MRVQPHRARRATHQSATDGTILQMAVQCVIRSLLLLRGERISFAARSKLGKWIMCCGAIGRIVPSVADQ